MKKNRIAILIILLSSIFSIDLYADVDDPLVGSNIDKIKTIKTYIYDKTDYPYIVIGKIKAESLRSRKAYQMLKEKALHLGADMILNYTNRADWGYTAEGVAVRWAGPGEIGVRQVPPELLGSR